MTEEAINNTVTVPEGSKIRTIRCTPMLRWNYPYGIVNSPVGQVKNLQQAWEVIETGEIEWRDIPFVERG